MRNSYGVIWTIVGVFVGILAFEAMLFILR